MGETSGVSGEGSAPNVITIDDNSEEEEETEVILRRSTRQTSRPKYLDDYVLFT